MENNFEHPVYSAEVIEFVAVAKEFCGLIEQAEEFRLRFFLERLRKFIPLLYLKGNLLPQVDSSIDEELERFVTEDDWLFIREKLRSVIGRYDEYTEEFEERMYESDDPDVASLSENITDIYNTLKDFLINYRNGVIDVMNEALWVMNDEFDFYWGNACVKSLRKIHDLLKGDIEEENKGTRADEAPDLSDSFIAQRQKEWGGTNV